MIRKPFELLHRFELLRMKIKWKVFIILKLLFPTFNYNIGIVNFLTYKKATSMTNVLVKPKGK